MQTKFFIKTPQPCFVDLLDDFQKAKNKIVTDTFFPSFIKDKCNKTFPDLTYLWMCMLKFIKANLIHLNSLSNEMPQDMKNIYYDSKLLANI